MRDRQVIVIGAGIAGLVAAYQLKKQGVDVLVLEASSKVGGRMVTDYADGYIIDGGAQFLSSAYPILSGLIKELGIASEYVETSSLVGIVRNGIIHKFRYDKPLSLLFGGLFNFKEWLSLGIGSFRLLIKTKKIPVNNYSAWNEFDDETTESWSNNYYGNHITEYFIEPLLEAFYFQSPIYISKALPIAINAFSAHKAKTMTLKSGIGKLPELIGNTLDVQMNTSVHKITEKNNHVLVFTENKELKAEKIILATPAPITRNIYKTPSILESKLLSTKYSSTVNISIALKNMIPKGAKINNVYGVWIPRNERKIIAAFTIETKKDTGRATSGELVNVMLSGEAGRIMYDRDDESILAAVLSELEIYIPDISGNISFTKFYRWLNAVPMSQVGHCRNIKDYRDTIQGSNRVVLSGDYLGMPFTEGAAETGLWAASAILNKA